MPGDRQKSVLLILARELASNVATPMFLVDPEGTLVYYNEPAEEILGQKFAEAGELTAEEWSGSLYSPETMDGAPLTPAEMPLTIAFSERRASHCPMVITGIDGVRRVISATAFPLLATEEELVGAVAIFWEDHGAA